MTTPSTSFAERHKRRRYIGVTVTGENNSPATFSTRLGTILAKDPSIRFRIVKTRRSAAIVEVPRSTAKNALQRWNSSGVTTHKTWGTLKKAKQWLSEEANRLGRS